MNILITSEFGGVAGSSYSILYLAKGLTEKGHNVLLLVPKGSFVDECSQDFNVNTLNIDFRLKFDWSAIRRINRIIKKHQIDLINPQESRDRYNVIFSKIIYRWKAKIVLSRRQRVADNNPIKRWLHVRYSDRIIAVSQGLKNLVVKKGFPSDHVDVIYNGLPTSRYVINKETVTHLMKKYEINPNSHVIGCVARLKRQDLLVKALSLLPHNYQLLLVGITREQFEKKYGRTLLKGISEQVVFCGLIHDMDTVIHSYALMDVCVLPSQMDGFGLTLIEGMAMGTPVIGSDYAGIPDVIDHGKTGFIFSNDNVEELVGYIRKAVEDANTRADLIQNGASTALNKFSIETTVTEYENKFRSIVYGSKSQ